MFYSSIQRCLSRPVASAASTVLRPPAVPAPLSISGIVRKISERSSSGSSKSFSRRRQAELDDEEEVGSLIVDFGDDGQESLLSLVKILDAAAERKQLSSRSRPSFVTMGSVQTRGASPSNSNSNSKGTRAHWTDQGSEDVPAVRQWQDPFGFTYCDTVAHLRLLLARGNPFRVQRFLEALQRNGTDILWLANSVIFRFSAEGLSRHLDDVFTLLAILSSLKVEPDFRTEAAIAYGHAKQGDVQKALDALREPTLQACNGIIRGLTEADRLEDALAFFDQFSHLYRRPRSDSDSDSDPDLRSHQGVLHIISALVAAGRLDQALAWEEALVSEYGGRRDVALLNSWTGALVKGKRWEMVKGVVERFGQIGVFPTPSTYALWVQGCAQGGSRNAELEAVEDALQSGRTFSVGTWNIVLDSLCRCSPRNVDLALKYFREGMPKMDVEPDRFTYTILGNGLIRDLRCQDARLILQMAVQGGIQMNVHLINMEIKSYLRERKFRQAHMLLDQLEEQGSRRGTSVRPNANTYVQFISSMAFHGRMDLAMAMLQRSKGLIHLDKKDEEMLYSRFVKFYMRNGNPEAATDWVQRMEADGVSPSILTYKLLVSGLVWHRRYKDALRWAKQAHDAGLLLDVSTPESFVLSFASPSQRSHALTAMSEPQ